MKAFTALVHRELIEHRGAFLIGPLLLVAVLFGATILAFTVGRVDARFSGAMLTVAPLRIYEMGFLGFGVGWSFYLMATLFFYAADGFAADKRNNAMLFWKSMPVGDFRMLLSKLTAAITAATRTDQFMPPRVPRIDPPGTVASSAWNTRRASIGASE